MRASTLVKLGLGAAVLALLAAAALRKPKIEPVKVVTARVQRSTVVRKVRAGGHVEPVTQVRVSANISGDVLALYVEEGDVVKKGAPIAEIDPERLRAVVRQAEASARSSEAAVRLEEAQLTQAETDLQRARELASKGLNTAAELDRVRSIVDVTRARLEGARQRVAQSVAALDEAKARLQQTKIRAPIDGSVIRLMKKVGERVRGSDLAEDVLLVLAPLHAMQVDIEVGEQEVINVARGQSAEIDVDALDGPPIPGRVVEIASSATIRFRGEERETTSFQVTVALDRIPERLRSGMSATVSILTATRTEALAVPIEAVTVRLDSQLEQRAEEVAKKKRRAIWDRDEDEDEDARAVVRRREKPKRVVFLAVDGKAEPRIVETGISSDTDFEILSGLSAGEEVIVGPYKAVARGLIPGTPIEVIDRLEAAGAAPVVAEQRP